MKYDIIEYPCEIRQGDKVKTADGRVRDVESIDGRFIRFTDGSFFGIKHPDIVGIAIEKKRKKEKAEE